MKELSIEEKARRYDEAIERAKSKINNDKDHVLYEDDVIEIFPELKESEDERIRKELIEFVDINTLSVDERHDRWIAWLEKQESVEEIVERCKKSWYNEGKIAGMAEGLSDDEKYQQGWHDGAFYDKESHTFRHAKKPINVTKWIYVDELLEKQGEQQPAAKVEQRL